MALINRVIFWVAVGFLPLLLTGCSIRPACHNTSSDTIQYEASRIAVSGGINRQEAQILATAYFDRFISGCGYAAAPRDRGAYWAAEVIKGYAGTSSGYIHIDKRTGAISRIGGPTVYPKDFKS